MVVSCQLLAPTINHQPLLTILIVSTCWLLCPTAAAMGAKPSLISIFYKPLEWQLCLSHLPVRETRDGHQSLWAAPWGACGIFCCTQGGRDAACLQIHASFVTATGANVWRTIYFVLIPASLCHVSWTFLSWWFLSCLWWTPGCEKEKKRLTGWIRFCQWFHIIIVGTCSLLWTFERCITEWHSPQSDSML